MKAPVYGADGKSKGKFELPADLFDGRVSDTVLHQTVTAFLTRQRQGTAASKNRAKVRGGSRKPWRQKGTGRARVGTIRSPLWRGGGVVFGPEPRPFNPKVPKQVRRLAVRSVLNARAMDGDLAVLEPLRLEAPRTKAVATLLDAIGPEGNVLILTDGLRPVFHLSARNLEGVRVLPWGEQSAFDLLWSHSVLVEAGALESAAADKAGGDETGGDE